MLFAKPRDLERLAVIFVVRFGDRIATETRLSNETAGGDCVSYLATGDNLFGMPLPFTRRAEPHALTTARSLTPTLGLSFLQRYVSRVLSAKRSVCSMAGFAPAAKPIGTLRILCEILDQQTKFSAAGAEFVDRDEHG